MMTLLSQILLYVLAITKQNNIDESHAVIHALKTVKIADEIYRAELSYNPYLVEQQNVIYASALVHDICDKKYVQGVKQFDCFSNLHVFLSGAEGGGSVSVQDGIKFANAVLSIITTSSYSYVKRFGYPEYLGSATLAAYHIMREADLFDGYDIERSIVYALYHVGEVEQQLDKAVKEVSEFFGGRVLQHRSDELFVTEYSKDRSIIADVYAAHSLRKWRGIVAE